MSSIEPADGFTQFEVECVNNHLAWHDDPKGHIAGETAMTLSYFTILRALSLCGKNTNIRKLEVLLYSSQYQRHCLHRRRNRQRAR